MTHAGPAFSLYNDPMEADAAEFPKQIRRHCERVLGELERYRQELSATSSRTLTAEAVAEGQAAIEAAAAATRKILDQLGMNA